MSCQHAAGESQKEGCQGDRGTEYLAADDTLLLLDRMRDLTTRTLHLEVTSHRITSHNAPYRTMTHHNNTKLLHVKIRNMITWHNITFPSLTYSYFAI